MFLNANICKEPDVYGLVELNWGEFKYIEFNISLHEKGVDVEYDDPVQVLFTFVDKPVSVKNIKCIWACAWYC